MTHEEFLIEYYIIAERALKFSEKARKEGLLALEEDFDQERINDRNIFDYGIRFVVDGIDREVIEKILSNLIEQEENENIRKLKNLEKEAVLMIQDGTNTRILFAILNSYTNLPLKEDKLNLTYGRL